MKIEIGQVVTQIISFLVMFWVLKRYAWKPLLKNLEWRKNKIKKEFETIEHKKKEINKLIEEYHAHIKDIDAYAHSKTQEAIEQGKQIAHEIQQEAQIQAKAIITKAQADLQKEIFKAKLQLKNEIANIAVRTAEKILQENLDKEKQQNLIADFIEQMGAN
jgi:F-type H+-transporting ATPase subunit b